MENRAMTLVLVLSGTYLYASDQYVMPEDHTFTFERTEQGYQYQVKNGEGKVLASNVKLASILERYQPNSKQLTCVTYQQNQMIDNLECIALRATNELGRTVALMEEMHEVNKNSLQFIRKQAMQLKLQSWAIDILATTFIGYCWYQHWYGTSHI